MIRTIPFRLYSIASACASLALAGAPARAWEVVGGGGLPVFAAGATPGAASSVPGVAAGPLGVAPAQFPGINPGYDFRIGQKFLVGVDSRTGFAATDGLFGFAPGFDASRTSMKFGYDMGRFKPFVMSSFAEFRPTIGAASFAGAGAPPGVATPFAPSAKLSTVGAGFDYAITDKLSFGMSVSASQATTGWGR